MALSLKSKAPLPPSENRAHRALSAMAREGRVTLTVRGACMAPLIEDGCRVEFRRQRHYLPGDILVFRSAPGIYAVHRLLGLYPRGGRWLLLTRGDRSRQIDSAFPVEHALGRVCGGEVQVAAVAIPLRHRLRAMAAFARIALQRRLGLGRKRGGS